MKTLLTFAIILLSIFNLNAQSLLLTPGVQGKLNLPKLTFEQIQNIQLPESGSIVYDITTNCVRFYNGSKWLCTDQNKADFSPVALNAWKVSDTLPTNGFQSNGIAVDSQGNIYIVGNFGGTFQFNGINYSNLGYSDIFVAKYNSSGVPQWLKKGGFSNTNVFAKDIVVDTQGNVFVAGTFYNQLNFDGTIIPSYNGSGDVFLCKLSANNGNVLTLKSYGGLNYETIGQLHIDSQNNLYMIGNFVGTSYFDNLSITGIDNNDIYIAKCNSNLQFQWVNKITGTNADDGRGIYSDNQGSIYTTGYIASNATFASGVTFSPGMQTLFVAKYNATTGSFIWYKAPISTGSMNYAHRVVCDNEGNAYVGGYFFGNINLGGFQFGGSGTNSDLFIAKINSLGDWQWVQTSYNTDYNGTEQFNDMKINSKNEVYLSCTTSFGSTFGFSDKRYIGNNFIFKFDKNGGVIGGNSISASGYNFYWGSITTSGSYYYLTGYFNGSVSFGSISLSNPASSNNGFVAKYVE